MSTSRQPSPPMRIRELSRDELSPEQVRVHDEIAAGPRGRVPGPLAVWLHSATLADRAQKLGQFCRYDSSLEPRLSELAILVTGRYWGAEYEWWAHKRIGLEAGLDPAIVEAIRERRLPAFEKRDERVVYEFASQLHRDKRVSDATYAEAVEVLGELSVVDLVGVCGYYTLISMTLNAFRVPLPEGVAPELD
jgi:4-carboxymuconolactone decarboxylase